MNRVQSEGAPGGRSERTGEEIHFAIGACSLGNVLVAQSGRGLCAVLLGSDHHALRLELRSRFPRAMLIEDAPGLENLVGQVVSLVEDPSRKLDLPLDGRGTSFQQAVWKALRGIPFGSTATYSEVAKAIGLPKAVRAVAGACGANPLAVVVPCHRVVRSDGSPSGYRWGLERKVVLLQREAGEAGL